MEQKRVTFDVAMALKEAGYPQGLTMYRYVTKCIGVMRYTKITHYVPGQLIEGTLSIFDIKHPHFSGISLNESIDVPIVIDAWLWLWQHKGIWLDPVKTGAELFTCYLSGEHIIGYHSNPEEAIEAAIKYLVNENLLK